MNAEAAPRVLVVDDEPNILDVITMALRPRGLKSCGELRTRPQEEAVLRLSVP